MSTSFWLCRETLARKSNKMGPAKRQREPRRRPLRLAIIAMSHAMAAGEAAHAFSLSGGRPRGLKRAVGGLCRHGLEPLGGRRPGVTAANHESNAGDSGHFACALSSTRESFREGGDVDSGNNLLPSVDAKRRTIQPEVRFSSTFLHALPAQAWRVRRGRDQKRETPGCS
jgi:hypothetical protein